jgi:hypothetical protein
MTVNPKNIDLVARWACGDAAIGAVLGDATMGTSRGLSFPRIAAAGWHLGDPAVDFALPARKGETTT